jgi:hypothetical protein
MNTSAILANPNLTKTEKIRQLLALGLTRRQVADLTGGNYGFVQNVFARYWPEQVASRNGQPRAEQFSFVPFNRRFGIEIEGHGIDRHRLATALREAGLNAYAEGYNHATAAHWKVVTDGSLTGEQSFELVSPVLEGLAGLEQVKTACEVLKRLRAKINRTCGLHIHFDAAAIGLPQMKNLLLNYSHYEGVIDSFMPESRRADRNTYCLPVRRVFQNFEGRVDAATSISALATEQRSRYHKINLTAYLRHRSIEFRQHSGTVEFEKISNWVVFLHNLVEFSRTNRVTAAEATFASLTRFQQPEVIEYIQTRINQLAA